MGVKKEKILIMGFSDGMVHFDRIEDNSELLSRIFRRIEFLKRKLYPLSHSESLELFEGEKFLNREFFSNVKVLVVIIESIYISDLSQAKYSLDLFLPKLSHYSPNASVFIFQPKVNLIKYQKDAVQKTLIEYLSTGVNLHFRYFIDVKEIIQKIMELD